MNRSLFHYYFPQLLFVIKYFIVRFKIIQIRMLFSFNQRNLCFQMIIINFQIEYQIKMENPGRQNSSERNAQTLVHQANPIEKRNLYQRYTNYIDSSKCTVQHYQQKKFFSGQQKYVHKITSWIEDDTHPNNPLVFKTQPGCGIKTILVNWQKNQLMNSYRKQKVLSIIHFASNGSNNRNYFYSLYRITIKLREALKLKQNVDLLQENIRKFFAYWLDICSSQVQKQLVIYCAQQIYHKIVIVIQGVDQFIDSETGKQANIAFWLPQIFPKNVKVIVTAAKGSQSLQHLQKIKCQIIDVKLNPDISSFLLKSAVDESTVLGKQTEAKLKQSLQKIVHRLGLINNSYNLIQFFDGCFLIKRQTQKNKQNCSLIKQIISQKLNFKKLQKVQSLNQLYNFVIDFWSQSSPLKEKLQKILIYLCLTQKGLTSKQVMSISNLSQNQWNLFLTLFNSLIVKYDEIYSIKSTSFINVFFQRLKKSSKESSSANNSEFLVPYHQRLALSLQSTPNCIRKLEQQTYHLFAAKSYFKLKEMISNIQNFLLMFNYNNKYQLSKYWQKLQEKGFDPVIEYNKAVQGFSMHYHPSDQNIFRIIVQISRFLKQFCDFQTYQTPNFRHPYIQGNAVQLHKIGLLKQLSDLDIFYDNSFNNNEDFDLNEQFNVQQQIKQLRQKYFPKQSTNFDELNSSPKNQAHQDTANYTNTINQMMKDLQQLSKKKIKKKSTSNVQILSQIQQLNVDVPMNRQKFRNHYLKLLQQFMKKDQSYGQSINQTLTTDKFYLDVQQIFQAVNPNTQNKVQYSFNKIRQNYRMRHIKPSLYYYKRWVWIQFPWVCISLQNNYSTTPELCKKIQGDDLDTLEQQSKYTKQALMVAIQARQKKRQMFTKKDDYLDTKSFSKTKTNIFTITKFNGSKFGDTSSSKAKLLAQKALPNQDLSLNALIKQLQVRKKRLKIQDQQNIHQSQIFLSQINQNCQQDMKFIALRKQFQPPSMQGMQPNEVLPKLKWVIKQHTNYQLSYIKSHIQQKKKKLNKIIYENKKLLQSYQEFKIKQQNQKKNFLNQHENQKQHKKNKVLQQLIKKKQEVISDFCKSLLQKQRLKIILKLCSENKTKNQEYLTSLNYLLQNLKKMINFEKQNMKSITEELQQIKVLKQKQNMLESQKQKNKQLVQRQAQNYLQEKSKLQRQIENITSIITDDIKEQKDRLESSLSGHMKNKEEKTLQLMQEKKTRLLEEKLQKLEEEYQCLRQLFEFEGFEFQKSQKFQKLMEEKQKNKKLKIAYFQRKNKLEQVMAQYQKIKQQNQKEVQDQLKKMSIKKQNSSKDRSNLSKNMDKKSHDNRYAIILDNIALKLGVKDKADIVNVLKNKIQYLKTHNMPKYLKLMGQNSNAQLHA